MARLISCGEHTIDVDLLSENGWVLDVGCRGYGFANEVLRHKNCRVIAVDPGSDIGTPSDSRIVFENVAVVHDQTVKQAHFFEYGDGYGSHSHLLMDAVPRATLRVAGMVKPVTCVTMQDLMNKHGVSMFEAVKLDCEGAEYGLLANWTGPIAKQISVEFHDFLGVNPKKDVESYYHETLEHLSKWYKVAQHERSYQFGINYRNYWDSLFVLK